MICLLRLTELFFSYSMIKADIFGPVLFSRRNVVHFKKIIGIITMPLCMTHNRLSKLLGYMLFHIIDIYDSFWLCRYVYLPYLHVASFLNDVSIFILLYYNNNKVMLKIIHNG